MAIEEYDLLRLKGYKLAGGLSDLAQRASVYHHMYQDSGGRNVFPLIAAHGALWASGYFKKGMIAGRLLSIQFLPDTAKRKEALQALDEFACKFRDINRKVCAEAYALYHYTKHHSSLPAGLNYEFKPRLLALLSNCHRSRTFDREEREQLFYEFFSWEQENIVAPDVEKAYDAFCWKSVKTLALQPNIKFSYFGKKNNLKFHNFYSKDERVKMGLQAYIRAEDVGLQFVEESLRFYKILPKEFFINPIDHHLNLAAALDP